MALGNSQTLINVRRLVENLYWVEMLSIFEH